MQKKKSDMALIRKGYAADWDVAMELAYRTFLKFNAKDYSEEGRSNFKAFVYGEELYKQFVMGNYQLIVAYEKEEMVGMLLLMQHRHISLLFVDGDYHRIGIGHALIESASMRVKLSARRHKKLIVNASPYALPFYEKEGFIEVKPMQLDNGIKVYPMELHI